MQTFYQNPRLTPAVRGLLIAIAAGFLLQIILKTITSLPVEMTLGFSPLRFLGGQFWQLFSYPFLHGSTTHLFFNGLMLFMTGAELERLWGTRRFLQYYFLCSVGGAILHTLIWVLSLAFFPQRSYDLGLIPIVGASGALYGLMVAFGKIYAHAQVLVFFVFPMKARTFVIGLAAFEIFSAIFVEGSGMAHLVHLGGLVSGFLYLKWAGNNLRGGGGSGGLFSKKKSMDRDELKKRLSVISQEPQKGDKNFPVTWN